MSITIQHIADELNVSVSTVSRSLRNDRLINPQTRARIQATAMNMGYQGRIRRKTKRTSSKVLRLVIAFSSESYEQACVNPNFLRYIEGIEAEADAVDASLAYEALPYEIRGKLSKQTLPVSIRSGKPDAIICFGAIPGQDVQLLSTFAPIVSLTWDYHPTPCDVVRPNEEQTFAAIVDQLVALGHRKLAWIGECPSMHTQNNRRQMGFVMASLKHGMPINNEILGRYNQLYDGFDMPYLTDHTQGITQPQILRHWIDTLGISALVCVSDRVGYNVMLNLRKLGIDVPGQVSVTGFDHQPRPDDLPQLTTVDPLFMEQARTAVRMAQQRKDRPTAFPQHLLHLCRMAEGQTTSPISSL